MAITLDVKKYRNKILYQALVIIYGLNISSIKNFARLCGINPNLRISDIPEIYLKRLEKYISDNIRTGRALKQQKQARVKLLWNIRLYRGLRLFQGLPANGQRSKTNAQTARKMGRKKNLYFKTDQAPGPRISGKPISFGLNKLKQRKHDPKSVRIKRKVTRKK